MSEKPELTDDLRQEYADLFTRAAIRPEFLGVVGTVVARLSRPDHWDRYLTVEKATGVPAHVVAVIHCLEASGNFSCHLHNGDPLTARTVRVPAGRPTDGEPPFPWEASAVDALALKHLSRWSEWSLPGIAYVLEGYNGWGYRLHHPQVKSPYLWGGTSVYTAGKYVADGTWSDTAVSKQCGAMALLARLVATGRISLDTPKSRVGVPAMA
jgi:lysozyme family protein